eukprot:CAMPEP_0194306288 /NCGR_PEP_ID=MMETSP0171-20130528/3505_1 /TAXON_ID=218684 /ORGANISM="Corethron pennatum, Strain L29A3" /LENGTH=38 /DNA_ID= /DNA_START= /DNA_END= /DNA_ORIENTATION=
MVSSRASLVATFAVAAVSTVSAWGTDSLVDDGRPRRAL